VDAKGKGHIISLSFGGLRLETRYVEVKHKRNLGIKTRSMETHDVKDVNIWELNLKTKRQAYRSEDPHHAWYELKSRGRYSREGGRM
jgi:hypothetical protein